jgi:RecB family endonuclease NucS
MELKQGDIIHLSSIEPIMTDQIFEEMLVGKSQNTTIYYMRKAKSLIIRGLLTRGCNRKAVSEQKEIIQGIYKTSQGVNLGRVFLLEGENKVTLLWQGPATQYGPNYRRIRDELTGKVPYRLYGKAAAKKEENIQGESKEEYGEKSAKKVPTQEFPLELSEKQFEDILAKYPELIEEGLSLEGRQVNVAGKAVDLLFKDSHGDILIVELKKGTIERKHIGQILDYEGYLVSEFNPATRVMLIGSYVPKNFQKSLEHHGIEYRHFSISVLREYLIKKSDKKLLDNLNW